MFRVKTTALCVCGAFSIAGCVSLAQHKAAHPWSVQPEFGVRHGGPNAEAMYRLGRLYQGQARYAEAIAAYRRALAKDPSYVDANNALGVIHAEHGRYDAAEREFHIAIALAPDAAYLRNNLGFALLLRGSNEEAVRVLEEAKRLDPDDETVLFNLRLANRRLSEAQQAQPPVQPEARAEAAVESRASSVVASAVVRTAPDSGVKLVAVGAGVYELQASSAEAARTESRSSAAAGIQVVAVEPAVKESAPPTHAVTAAPALDELRASVISVAACFRGSAPAGVRFCVLPREVSFPALGAHPGAPAAERRGIGTEREGEISSGRSRLEPSRPPTEVHPTPEPPGLRAFKLEVSNGNGVAGMASRVARFLEPHGVPTGRLTNATTFREPTTQIQYRQGYRAEAARLGSMLPKPVPAIQAGTLRSDIHVRLVLGRDVRNDTALFDAQAVKVQLAANAENRAGR